MRLSTEPTRANGLAVLAAALDAGVDLLDTADAYALDDADRGHSERLIAEAIAGRAVTIVTKGGLTRPGGAWIPDGRAKHLAAAARASRERLGRIDLYLLHAVDPKVPLATSVRALARVKAEGVAAAIGLANVNATQLEAALAIAEISAVEVELNPWHLDALRGGLVALCARRGIQVLAHRPLGGPAGAKRIARDAAIGAIAQRIGATPVQVVLAWLRALGTVPLPGATRIETAVECARIVQLDPDDVAALSARTLSHFHHPSSRRSSDLAQLDQGAFPISPVVTMTVGMPGSGKSTLAAELDGVRLNRDERGGGLADIARAFDRELAAGAPHVILDNTYGTRAQRAAILEIAQRHGARVHAIVLATTLEEAQHNAVARILDRHDRLLEPHELRGGELPPSAQFRYRRAYEPPRLDEGFASLEERSFVRRPHHGAHAGAIVELDGFLWKRRPRSLAELELRPEGLAAIAELQRDRVVGGTTWLTAPEVHAHVAAELGIAIACCTHPAGPPICWCRKPMPGLGLVLARRLDLDLARTIVVGSGPADRGFALRLGCQFTV